MQKHPNIVLIMADQLAPQFTGAYGHPLVKTRHMEALAARGTRFDAAYCNSPLCAPSRASFMAGQQVSKIAAYDNAAEFPATIPTFAHYLRAAGYSTVLSGKMHFVGPDQLHGFEERLTTDIYPADTAWTPNWEDPDRRIAHWYHNMDAVRQADQAMTTFQYDYDDEAVFLARRRIFDHAMSADQPLAMVVSLIHPHDPYVARPEYWDLYDNAQIDMPASPSATDAHSARLALGIEAHQGAVTEQEIRNARHGYYANTSYFDANVGKIVKALEEADMLDNTIVVVTADHGDMLGERGLWYKMSWLEHSARVPLIVAGPGVRQQEVAAPCSLVDILPTFREIAQDNGALGMAVDGVSLWPTLTTGTETQTEAIGEYCAEMTPGYPVCMIRRGRWKYIHCAADDPQLFDLEEDPGELTNLAADAGHAQIAAEFAKEATERWDDEAIRSDVIASQRMRRVVQPALETGRMTPWDYQPPRDATQEFVRNTVSWDDVLHRMQYPAPRDHK
ncbi:Choline-sulfatase [Candidatus Rhodobacter oscarellae]|uniref:Choline-sulfatase n=1 Tax=Candidatus Rhodobacter oscarellae TaxID=1675527 RepID=A0A0J9E7G1_9RHOB|nr:choline-sulfatase [Candidatus Rhodobacter lobularis]KMW58631.1 Choline-sulfatase [Candidatus Rhodobacter lobularis]